MQKEEDSLPCQESGGLDAGTVVVIHSFHLWSKISSTILDGMEMSRRPIMIMIIN